MVKILQDSITGQTWNVESEWKTYNTSQHTDRALQMARMLAQQTQHPIHIHQFVMGGSTHHETTVHPRPKR